MLLASVIIFGIFKKMAVLYALKEAKHEQNPIHRS
jgi:hypothetical protein